jgi:hypothetical protein
MLYAIGVIHFFCRTRVDAAIATDADASTRPRDGDIFCLNIYAFSIDRRRFFPFIPSTYTSVDAIRRYMDFLHSIVRHWHVYATVTANRPRYCRWAGVATTVWHFDKHQ